VALEWGVAAAEPPGRTRDVDDVEGVRGGGTTEVLMPNGGWRGAGAEAEAEG